jgi:hypothetical protein
VGKLENEALRHEKVRNRVNYKDFINVYADSSNSDLSTSFTVCSSRCRLSV